MAKHKKIIMGTRVTRRVPSPTGQPSKVSPDVEKFMRGESTAGKRPLSEQPAPAIQRGGIDEVIRERNLRMEEASGMKKKKRRMRKRSGM